MTTRPASRRRRPHETFSATHSTRPQPVQRKMSYAGVSNRFGSRVSSANTPPHLSHNGGLGDASEPGRTDIGFAFRIMEVTSYPREASALLSVGAQTQNVHDSGRVTRMCLTPELKQPRFHDGLVEPGTGRTAMLIRFNVASSSCARRAGPRRSRPRTFHRQFRGGAEPLRYCLGALQY